MEQATEQLRSLLTGLQGAALRDHILARPIDPETLWIAPSPLAAEQILARLTRRRGLLRHPRVWTWPDLWHEVGRDQVRNPPILSDASRLCLLSDAIQHARSEGAIEQTTALLQSLGYRRGVLRTFDRWISREVERPRFTSEYEREEWGLYRYYRQLIADVGAEDEAGYAVWASRSLEIDPTPHWQRFRRVVLFEPRLSDRASWRAVKVFHDRARSVEVTISGRPGLSEARDKRVMRFLDLGFEETCHGPSAGRAPILTFLESRLFDSKSIDDPPNGGDRSLRVLGAPRGEGLALVIAREVRERIASGIPLDEILILVPHWDDQAERIVETLQAWGIASAGSEQGPLTSDPAISALLRAARLPTEDWDASRLAGLLRHGQVGSSWPDLDLPQAALAITETRVFRNPDALRRALSRVEEPDEDGSTAATTRRAMALKVLDRLTSLFHGVDSPETWPTHVARLVRVVEALGLDRSDGKSRPIDALMNGLDEVSEVRLRLGREQPNISWDAFLDEVDAVARVSRIPSPRVRGGSIRVTTVDAADGTRAEIVILANLGEGTFPSRNALDLHLPDSDPAMLNEARRQAVGREMDRFLRVIGSANRAVVLAYPTKDEAGVPLNMAGFLDEIRDRFRGATWEDCSRILPRLMPILNADLVGSPHEQRVRTIGLACANPGVETFPALAALAADPEHRGALDGVAASLRVAHYRQGRRLFGPFDGILHDPAAARRIAEDFGPRRPAFSASQLESLAFCPFQFFLRYVCRITPTQIRGEFDEDFSTRGSIVHEALQTLHEQLRDTPADDGGLVFERVSRILNSVVQAVFETYDEPQTEAARGARLIESRVLEKIAGRYARQFASYLNKNPDAVSTQFEVGFGPADGALGPCLELGAGDDLIRLQGKIDRIDRLGGDDASPFRIIDYKSGGAPGIAELKKGVALQLPLYAMAVESVLLAGQGSRPDSAGYWSLKKEGYRSLVTMSEPVNKPRADHVDWPKLRGDLERFVVALVRQLRQGRLPVRPRSSDCTKACDFSTVCRIGSLKHVNKIWTDAPNLEWEE